MEEGEGCRRRVVGGFSLVIYYEWDGVDEYYQGGGDE